MEYNCESTIEDYSGRLESQPLNNTSWPLKVKEKVGQVYYKYGLLCSSHPWIVISITLFVFFISCYPILGTHFFHSNCSQKYITHVDDYISKNTSNQLNLNQFNSKETPKWFLNQAPHAIVQQVFVKSAVIPWLSNLILMDGVRTPLAQVFSLVEFISNYQIDQGNSKPLSLTKHCFQINEPMENIDNIETLILPRFSCLILSPANIWKNNVNKFLQDSTIIQTIFKAKDYSYADSGFLREILFGIPWSETGIKPFYVKTRQRTITFGITIIFSRYDYNLIQSLTEQLREKYPIYPFSQNEKTSKVVEKYLNQITHIYFQNKFTFSEYTPLIGTYFILFCCIYFSVRKIDLIKYKWALAGASVLTLIMSLLMTLGICSWFDFNHSLNGRELLPYLIVIIGLENTLVLTRSVVFTPAHLDIKVRVAQGLSREGWPIIKNLASELTLLAFGYFTFFPIIQETSLSGMIFLLSDFFLQLTIYVTFLSMDIQKVELDGLNRKANYYKSVKSIQNNLLQKGYSSLLDSYSPTKVLTFSPQPFKLPKRLRFVYFWARTRLVHRFLMFAMVIWISILLYKSDIVDHFSPNNPLKFSNKLSKNPFLNPSQINDPYVKKKLKESVSESLPFQFKHSNQGFNYHLSSEHWSTLFGYYNISLSGKYISFLPPIHLSIPVEPNEAIKNRHPFENDFQKLYPSSFLDSIEDSDEINEESSSEYVHSRKYLTFKEIMTAFICLIPTIFCIVYIFITLYRCMCSRRYDEWRSSWSNHKFLNLKLDDCKNKHDMYTLEAMIKQLSAHEHEIEMIASTCESPFVVSCCMEGDVRIWDVLSGECHTYIKRFNFHLEEKSEKSSFKPHHKQSGSFSSDSTYSSSPSTGSSEFKFEANATTNELSSNGYNFGPFYSRLYASRTIISELVLSAATNDSESIPLKTVEANKKIKSLLPYQQIWCLDVFKKYILIGCSKGRIEIWDAITGASYSNEKWNSGVTTIKANDNKLVAGHLDGVLELYQFDENLSSKTSEFYDLSYSHESHDLPNHTLHFHLLNFIRAHSQPITALRLNGSHFITGSADRLLKVYKIETGASLYTLHGHFGGISCLEIDNTTPHSALSGCKAGQVCLWDLMTGTCLFNLEAHHKASVTSLLATSLYVISTGSDNKINIWDKYSGHSVYKITNQNSICQGVIALAPNILITAKDDYLTIWDISEATELKVITLDSCHDKYSFIKNLKLASKSQAVVCDYGQYLYIIHFPGLTQKCD